MSDLREIAARAVDDYWWIGDCADDSQNMRDGGWAKKSILNIREREMAAVDPIIAAIEPLIRRDEREWIRTEIDRLTGNTGYIHASSLKMFLSIRDQQGDENG